MSDNTEILIIKNKNKWDVFHHDVDDCFNNKIGQGFETLEEAVDCYEKWVKEYYEYGFGPEYGIRIIKGRQKKN